MYHDKDPVVKREQIYPDSWNHL